MNPSVQLYFENLKKYKAELNLLRSIVLNCGLTEELKWKQPCYTSAGKNAILLGAFKDRCFISFLQGNLLKDELNLLEKVGENTVSGRVISFTQLKEVEQHEDTIKAYVFEAIEVSKKKVKKLAAPKIELPEELEEQFKINNEFKIAFEKLTPGRQRGYLIYFKGAKQSVTKTTRIQKNIQRIINGYGFNDCTCGLSKRKPTCDGSHKILNES